MSSRVVPLVVAAAILVPTAMYALRRRDVRGAVWYAVLLFAVAFWCAAYALELMADDAGTKLLLQKIKYAGIVTIPVAWLGFILEFLAREPHLVSQVTRALIPVSASILALAWTNDVHGLFWGQMTLVRSGDLSVLLGRGPVFWVNIVYVYLAVWAGVGVLVAQAFRQPYVYRKRVAVLTLSAVLPWMGNVMFLARHPSLQMVDPAPLLFAATALAASVAVFRYGDLQPVPTLRDARIAVIGDGLVVLDRKAAVVDMNRRAERILGRQRSDVAGRPIGDLVPGIEWREQGEWRQDLRLPGPDGDRIYDVNVTPMRNARKRLTGYVVVLHDVTERRDLEEQLRQAQKMEAVGKLAGGVAHDFNNLLTAILGFATLAEEEVPPDSPVRDALWQIRRSAEQAAILTRQLLAFGRRQILQPEVLDLNRVVSTVEPMLRRLIGEDITIVTDLAADLPPLRADRSQLEQVLLNLAVNARDAMPTGGVLTIRTFTVTEAGPRLDGDGLPEGTYVALEITDTGEGIDPQVLERIFEPFFTTKEFGRGTGLGLSMVYGIVKQSGGDVRVRTTLNRGTTFTVLLPAAGEPQTQATQPEPAAPPDLKRARVLLVEDDEAVRDLVEEVLRTAELDVVVAPGPAEALAMAARQSLTLDLLITDLVMPTMSGIELAERLTSLRPGIRVLFISGYPVEEMAARGHRINGMHCLAKPFTPGQLRHEVRALLETAH
ncbi:MAG TPA: histidine kinase N-terminal 7TM domain-containing protein [Vicinamibacterales bacterium]